MDINQNRFQEVHSYIERPPADVPSVFQENVSYAQPEGQSADLGRKENYIIHKNGPPRLLVVCNKIKNGLALQGAVLSSVIFVQYKYDTTSLETLLACISQHLGSKKVETVAIITHGSASGINFTGKDDKCINKDTVVSDEQLKSFFIDLVSNHIEGSRQRIDFLSTQYASGSDSGYVTQQLQEITSITIGIHKDFIGSEVSNGRFEDSKSTSVGELYFREERLRGLSGHNQSLAGFEKIRTVGKGAYGTAILYKKKDDDSLVILKEINLHDLNASERQLALNEVRVLAMLDHPNIISYYDSFEEDGVVMIEMEYADGGTLGQFLSQQSKIKSLDEREILFMFNQMVAAIKYIHEHNILHRDLKTANIFLTREGVVKVGDFGISKLMSTSAKGASTVLGTPYYISPEMCEGKPYNHKSDIWALGCILYEMACLQKTFEGTNLPALVNKIMKGKYAPVKGNYSEELKSLVMSMLQRDPEDRPSATELWCDHLPQIMSRFEDQTSDCDDELTASQDHSFGRKKKTSSKGSDKRSVLYYFEMASLQLNPIQLGSRVKIRDVAVSQDHVIAVTTERVVFTWGDGSKGQLGHGNNESLVKPTCVEGLKGKSIVRVCCGSGFSVFGSDNGIVLTCGDGTKGCLGHGDYQSASRPRLIEALLSVDVIDLACGPYHVVAVGSDSQVFTWGSGSDGKLGLSSDKDHCLPQEVTLSDPVCVRSCFCGIDSTMLLTDVGSVLACGNNQNNKLGLNQRQGFLMAMKNIFNKVEVQGEKEFMCVRTLTKHRVMDISMGRDHVAVVVEPGHVYTLGRNSEGQLGIGNTKPQNAPVEVKTFEGKPATRIQCGEFYTVASTTHNDLLYWGTRYKNPPKHDDSFSSSNGANAMSSNGGKGVRRSESHPASLQPSPKGHRRQASTASVNSLSSVKEHEKVCNPETGEQPRTERQSSTELQNNNLTTGDKNSSHGSFGSGGFRPLSTTPRRSPSISGLKDAAKEKEANNSREDTELILQPTALIRLDSSGTHSQAGDTVTLSKFFCHGENLFLQVETTAPPPKRRSRRQRNIRRRLSGPHTQTSDSTVRMSASSRDGGDEYSSEASELDSKSNIFGRSKSMLDYVTTRDMTFTQEIPGWLKQELADASHVNNPKETKAKKKKVQEDMSGVSGHSEDEPHSLEDSITSIRINKNLSQGAKPKTVYPRGDKVQAFTVESMPKMAHSKTKMAKEKGVKHKKTPSAESGIEFTTLDRESSSESSDAAAITHAKEEDSKLMAANAVKRAANQAKPKRIAIPAAYKSKAGPAIPLSRIRAQGKSKRSDESFKIGDSDVKQRTQVIENLQIEVERMREEKKKTEERLRQMEDAQHQQRDSIRQETEKKATEREQSLKGEILDLKQELRQQSSKLQENYDVVINLQNQLLQVQSEQMRMSTARDERPSSRSSNRESKICSVQ